MLFQVSNWKVCDFPFFSAFDWFKHRPCRLNGSSHFSAYVHCIYVRFSLRVFTLKTFVGGQVSYIITRYTCIPWFNGYIVLQLDVGHNHFFWAALGLYLTMATPHRKSGCRRFGSSSLILIDKNIASMTSHNCRGLVFVIFESKCTTIITSKRKV